MLDSAELESQQGQEIFLFSEVSRLALVSALPHIHWVPGFFLRGEAPRA